LDNNQKNLTNVEKLSCIVKYNPYFSIEDEKDKKKYKYNRQAYIFDYVNFSKITPT
jgi:hypothetical protein